MRPRHRLRPSSADKWTKCHGWLAAVASLPPSPSSEAAEEGTEAHSILECALRIGCPPSELTTKFEMGERLDRVYEDILEMAEGRSIYLEHRVQFTSDPQDTGTIDVAIIGSDSIRVIDLKYGWGRVEADAIQLALYLLGALRVFGGIQPVCQKYCRAIDVLGALRTFGEIQDRELWTYIHQPKHRKPLRGKQWSIKELIAVERLVRDAMHANLYSPNPKRTPGDHCLYCDALAHCHEVSEFIMGVSGVDDF